MPYQGRKDQAEALKKVLAARCRRARQARGFSQQEVASKLHVDAEFYARIERGLSLPSMETFAGIVRVLGVTASGLLGFSELDVSPEEAARAEVARRRKLLKLERAVRKASPQTVRFISRVLRDIEEVST